MAKFPVSCQARVLVKQKDTGCLPLTPPHPSSTPASASQQHFSQFLLSLFHQEQDLRYVRSCPIQTWRKRGGVSSHWSPVAVNSCIVSQNRGSSTLKFGSRINFIFVALRAFSLEKRACILNTLKC